MGLCKIVKNFAIYGTLTVAGMYMMAGCEPRKPNVPQSPLEKATDEGLQCIQDGLKFGRYGIQMLEKRVEKARNYLGGK